MPGFLGVINRKSNGFKPNDRSDLLIHKYQDALLYAETRWINKFHHDKVFHESDRFLVVTDGVIFNLHKLLRHYQCDDLGNLCEEMYEVDGENFFRHFRGSFSGLIWDKAHQKLILFTDQIGDKPIFYARVNDSLVFGSELGFVVDYFRNTEIYYTLNEQAAWQMVTYGFLLEENTFVKETSKLCAGRYLVWTEDKVEIKSYHYFFYQPDESMSDNDIIACTDDLFTQAVERQTNKNEEYGYQDIAPLSAGMDTRMVNYCIRKVTGKPTLNFTYSQRGFFDEALAKEIAGVLKNPWIFKTGDQGYSLYNLDESVKINSGHMAYYGVAVVDDIFSEMNPDRFGLIHTGLRGSGTISTYNPGGITSQNIMTDAFSSHLSVKMQRYLDVHAIHSKYQYLELFTLYNCGFGGLNMGSPMVFRQQTESYSPFLDVDFLEFCLTIPFEKRYDNKIYDAWMLAKYPEAARFMHNGTRYIGGEKIHKRKPVISVGKRFYSLSELPRLLMLSLMRKAGLAEKIIPDQGIDSPHNVAPVGYWYSTNEELRCFLDHYFNQNISRLNAFSELKKDVMTLYFTGNGMEKNQVLTLLAVLRNYFDKES